MIPTSVSSGFSLFFRSHFINNVYDPFTTFESWVYPLVPRDLELNDSMNRADIQKIFQDLPAPQPETIIQLDPSIFGTPIRKDILHTVTTWQRAKRRSGNSKTKTVSEIAGSGKKPFRQKGTGRARQGQKRRPGSRGGAKAHGPQLRYYDYPLPRSVRILGLKIALASKYHSNSLTIVDQGSFPTHKTFFAESLLSWHQKDKSLSLFVDKASSASGFDSPDQNLIRSTANIPHFNILPSIGLNVLDILRHDNLILTIDALDDIQARLSNTFPASVYENTDSLPSLSVTPLPSVPLSPSVV